MELKPVGPAGAGDREVVGGQRGGRGIDGGDFGARPPDLDRVGSHRRAGAISQVHRKLVALAGPGLDVLVETGGAGAVGVQLGHIGTGGTGDTVARGCVDLHHVTIAGPAGAAVFETAVAHQVGRADDDGADGVGVQRVVTHVRGGQQVVGRHIDAHLVAAELDLVKQVVSAGVGRGDAAGVVGSAENAVIAGADQRDLDAGHAGFAGILHAVVVGIQPDPVAQLDLAAHQAGIHRQFAVARVQHHQVGLAGGLARVAVNAVTAVVVGILDRQVVAIGRDELHAVAAGDQVAEQVAAVGTGGLRGHDRARRIAQIDCHTGCTRFADVLDAVAVGVQPHPVAQAGRAVQAGVDGVVRIAGVEHVVAGLASGVDVAVQCIAGSAIATHILGRDDIVCRGHHPHAVSARRHVETIAASRVGGGGAHHIAGRIAQIDRDVVDAGLTRILHAVGVLVLEYKVADVGLGRYQLAEIVADAVHTGNQRDGADLVVGHRAAGRASGVLAVRVVGRLGLGHRVAAGAQAAEVVTAVGASQQRDAHRLTPIIGARQGDGGAGDARLTSPLEAVVVDVVVDTALDAGGLDLTEVHTAGHITRVQHDAADLVVGKHAAAVAGAVLAVQITGRLGFGHRVSARAQVGELVVAVGIGLHRDGDGLAQVVGAGDDDRGADDARLASTLHAVVVLVLEHRAQNAGRLDLTEVVVHAGHAGRQRDGRDLVVVQRAAGRAHRVLAVKVARGLGFGHRVVARAQAVEGVAAVGGCGGAGQHRLAPIIGACQRDGGTGDAGIARALDAVVVAVVEHHAGDAGGLDLAKIVVVADQALRQHDVADDVVAGGAVAVQPCGVDAVQLAGRLHRLGDAVAARAQAEKGVRAVGGGDGAGCHRRTQVVGAGQVDRHAAEAHVRALLDAVVVVVAIDKAANLRAHQLAEVVAHAVVASSQHHAADHIVDRHAAAVAAGRVLAVQVSAGLGLGHAVGACRQAGELIKTLSVGHGGGRHRMAQVVHTRQADGDAADHRLSGAAHTVVAEVFVDITRQLGRGGRHGQQAGVNRLVGFTDG